MYGMNNIVQNTFGSANKRYCALPHIPQLSGSGYPETLVLPGAALRQPTLGEPFIMIRSLYVHRYSYRYRYRYMRACGERFE